MGNRFSPAIRRGEIASIEELKSRFKALAKETHPDLGGVASGADAFAALRAEYEAALVDFDRHRFGSGAPRQSRGEADAGGNPFRPSHRDLGPGDLHRRLRDLRRRGFPKVPRHEKERLRYEYRRYLCVEALQARGGDAMARFEAFEAFFLGAAMDDPEASVQSRLALDLLDALVECLVAPRAGLPGSYEVRRILMEYRSLVLARDGGGEAAMGGQSARRLGDGGDGLTGLLGLLAEDLGARS